VNRAGLLLRRYGLDALIVAAAGVSGLGAGVRETAPVASVALRWVEAAVITAVILILLLRRRFPFGAPATMWVCSAALSFLDGRLITDQAGVMVAGLCAALLLGNLSSLGQARLGLLVVIAGAAIVVGNDPLQKASNLFFLPMLFAIGWLVGFALRERTEEAHAAEERAAQAEREREAAARVAVAEERARIARELHDVVAHAVSVMVLQVGAVRHGMADSPHREALENVERAGRGALAEMRRLLGAMRQPDDELDLVPHPRLDKLEALAEDVRAAGLAVTLQVHGEAVVLPPALDLSAYRILQEALTNTLKHANARQAQVTVQYCPEEIRLEVSDDGRGPTVTDGLGHGLVGVRERVKIYGGDMSTGPAVDGGFVLRARMPLDRVSR
jgi:signal transduction histidine kinase